MVALSNGRSVSVPPAAPGTRTGEVSDSARRARAASDPACRGDQTLVVLWAANLNANSPEMIWGGPTFSFGMFWRSRRWS